jgi:hypothetical protein
MDKENKYEKNENYSIYNSINFKRKPDGTPYRSRIQMKEEYDKSVLPYPLKAIWKLDYCWNIVKSHIFNSIFFSIPFTLVYTYAANPKVRNEGMRSKPFIYYVSAYILVYSLMSTYFVLDSLIFCEYCKPWSSVYSIDNKNETYKEILRSRIKSQQSQFDAQVKKTKDKGLKDEEL